MLAEACEPCCPTATLTESPRCHRDSLWLEAPQSGAILLLSVVPQGCEVGKHFASHKVATVAGFHNS
eukprot:4521114-Amphidinium_carterae.1